MLLRYQCIHSLDILATIVQKITLSLHPGHPWIRDQGVAPDRPLDTAVLSRIKQFSAMNKLKKMALRVSLIL